MKRQEKRWFTYKRMFVKFALIFFLAILNRLPCFCNVFSLDYNIRKDDVMLTLATFLDDPTLDFVNSLVANARLVTLAPGLRRNGASRRWLGDKNSR